MSWLKIDDLFHSHPKIARAGLAAVGLWTVLLSWAGCYGTDGVIPREIALRFAGGDAELVLRLVNAKTPGGEHGLLEELPDGSLRLHDFHHYQPRRARDPDAARTARSEAASRNAAARWGGAGLADEPTVAELGTILDGLDGHHSIASLAKIAGVSPSTLGRFRAGQVRITAETAKRITTVLRPLHAALHATSHASACNDQDRAVAADAEVRPTAATGQGTDRASAVAPTADPPDKPVEDQPHVPERGGGVALEHVGAGTVARHPVACGVHAPDPDPDPREIRENTHTTRARAEAGGVDPLAAQIRDELVRILPTHLAEVDPLALAETMLGTITTRHPSPEAAARCMPLVREAIQEAARELGSMRAARHGVAPRDVTRITTRFVEAKVRGGALGEQRTFGFATGLRKTRATPGAPYPTTPEASGANVKPLPPGWEPSEEVLQKLEGHGFTREHVAEHLEAFRYYERDQRYEDWGAELFRYLHTRRVREGSKAVAEG